MEISIVYQFKCVYTNLQNRNINRNRVKKKQAGKTDVCNLTTIVTQIAFIPTNELDLKTCIKFYKLVLN